MEAAPKAPGPLAWLEHAKREPSDPFDLLGDVLDGQFRVESFVGEGELSVVYKGQHLGVEAPVAIKCLNLPETLHPALARPLVQGFKRASRVQYRLARGNLHIAQAIASGSTLAPRTGVSVPYLVREWFDGEPLATQLARRRQESREGRPLDEALGLFESAFDAVSYAHGQGEAHLALNPTNLFLAHASTGVAPALKVLDFGMAGTMGALGSGANPSSPQPPPGLRLLLPAYAAPEQLERTVGRLGPWTDVYALALVVLEVLSDRVVMSSSETGALVERVLDERLRPTPQTHGLKLPAYVDRALTRAVARAPEARQRSAAELWREISRAGTVISLPWSASQAPRPSPSMAPRRAVSEVQKPADAEVVNAGSPLAQTETPTGVTDPITAQSQADAAPQAEAQPQPDQAPAEVEASTEVFRPAVLAPARAGPAVLWRRLRADGHAWMLARIAVLRPRLSKSRVVVLERLTTWLALGKRLLSTRRRKVVFAGLALGLLLLAALPLRRGSATQPAPKASADPVPAAEPTLAPTIEPEPAATAAGPRAPFNRDSALRALDRKWRAVARCRRGKAWGKETAKISFAEDGSVADVTLGPLFQGTPTGQCVANILATVHVPRFDDGRGAIDYRVYVAPR